jgi:hypothetical protein
MSSMHDSSRGVTCFACRLLVEGAAVARQVSSSSHMQQPTAATEANERLKQGTAVCFLITPCKVTLLLDNNNLCYASCLYCMKSNSWQAWPQLMLLQHAHLCCWLLHACVGSCSAQQLSSRGCGHHNAICHADPASRPSSTNSNRWWQGSAGPQGQQPGHLAHPGEEGVHSKAAALAPVLAPLRQVPA